MKPVRHNLPAPKRTIQLCLTGGIACGKSLAGDMLKTLKVPVIDADQVCRDLMQSNKALLKRLIALFGKAVLGANGKIDRAALGRLVFADTKKLNTLNRLVHPQARRNIESWLKEQSGDRQRIVAVLVPLVYEAQWERKWDKIICVSAPITMQIARLRQRGLTAAAAKARIAAQWPVTKKMLRADYVVFNSGTPEYMRRQLISIIKDITQHMEK